MSSSQAVMVEPNVGTPFMLPGMSSPEVEDLQLQIEAGERVVRFDQECVLIPELNAKKQRSPIVMTKSYSLPLWKKKGAHQPMSDSEADSEETAQSPRGQQRSPSPQEERLIIKVPIPTFRRRTSRSPQRGRSASSSPVVSHRLPSCLVHRDAATLLSTSPHPGMPIRRPSLPVYHRRKEDAYIRTIPLRECCHACEPITEECLKMGENWQEKFSRGARRKRSASLDYQEMSKLSSVHARAASLGSSGAESSSTAKFSLTVDEVDKRRKSLEVQEHVPFFSCPISSSTAAEPSSHNKEPSNSSTTSAPEDSFLRDLYAVIPDILTGSPERTRLYRSSPIEEEDEALLFPLPKRSPSGTPSPKVSPAQSPNVSTTCLALPNSENARAPTKASGSKESVVSVSSSTSNRSGSQKQSPVHTTSSQESVLKGSLSRKPPVDVGKGHASKNGRLSIPSTPSGSRNSSPTSRAATTVTSSNIGPSKGGRLSPRSSSALAKEKPMPILTSRGKGVDRPLPSPTLPPTPEYTKLSISTSLPVVSTSPEAGPSSYSNFPSSSSLTPVSPKLSTSPRLPSGTTPTSPSQTPASGRRKLSLTAPFIRAGGALKGVSVDMLKGVSFGGAQF